jgi:hypothetical protein
MFSLHYGTHLFSGPKRCTFQYIRLQSRSVCSESELAFSLLIHGKSAARPEVASLFKS